MARRIGMAACVRGARCSPTHLPFGPAAVIVAMAVALAVACGPGDPPERAEVVLSIGYAAPADAGEATGLAIIVDQLTREGLFRSGPARRVEPMPSAM